MKPTNCGITNQICCSLGLAAVFLVGAQLAFEAGTIVTVVPALLAFAIAGAATIVAHYSLDAVDRVRMRDTFGRFVPAPVVDEALAATGDDLRLNGVRREATVLFGDLRGFTGLAESLEPEQVVDVLNHYLTEMTEAIMGHGGTLVAYMGDGIMAIFGAPLEQPDHVRPRPRPLPRRRRRSGGPDRLQRHFRAGRRRVGGAADDGGARERRRRCVGNRRAGRDNPRAQRGAGGELRPRLRRGD